MIGDVVELPGGLVGVIGERTNGAPVRWRVYFRINHLEVSQITATLDPASFEVGETVVVWPDRGDITSIDGDLVTVEATRQMELAPHEFVTWTATLVVPMWHIARYNDPRISDTAAP